MSDYIKREDAIQAFDPLQRQDWYTPWIVETLEDLPSADVVPMERYKSMENTCVKLQKSLADVAPVRHGRWIDKGDGAECSICGSFWKYDGVWDRNGFIRVFRYCETCGTRMDEDGGEDE